MGGVQVNIEATKEKLTTFDGKMKFLLEDFIKDRKRTLPTYEEGEAELTREIERLITSENYEKAYDLYYSNGYDEKPFEYDEFIHSMTSTESSLE